MDKGELRRAIAEAVGWRVEVFPQEESDEDGFATWARLYDPAGVCVANFKKLEDAIIQYEADYVWRQALARTGLIPEWPNDPDAAWLLIVDIVERNDCKFSLTTSKYADDGEPLYAPRISGKIKAGDHGRDLAFTLARLARLALAALEAQAVADE